MLAWGDLTQSIDFTSGALALIETGNMTIEFLNTNGFTDYAASSALNMMIRGVGWTLTGLHADWSSTSPSNADTGGTPIGEARISCRGSFAVAAGGADNYSESISDTDIDWPATSGNRDLQYLEYWDASTVGNLIYWGAATTPASANTVPIKIAAGNAVNRLR